MAANPSIQLGTDGNWAIKEDNLLAYKKDGTRFFNKEFDFSRGSLATFIDKDGLIKVSGVTNTELVTNGDFGNTSANWNNYISGSSTVVFTDVATLNIDASNSNVGIYQENVFISGKRYKIVVKMKASSEFNAEVLESQGGATRANIGQVSLTTSYKEFTFYHTAIGVNDIFIHRLSSASGANESIIIDNVSVVEVQTDVPRIDFKDDTTGHLLLEPQSTNLITYSEDFSDSSWTKNNCTIISNNSISPDGTQNADKLNFTTSNGEIVRTTSFTSGQQYTMSFYAKTESGTLNFKYGNVSYENVSGTATTEWQKFEITQTPPTASRYPKIQTTEIGSLLLWGFQVEELPYATSYIPTSGSTATRNAEVCNNSGSVQDFNSEEGVLYAEISALADDETHRYISLSDGTSNNRIIIRYVAGGSNLLGMFVKVGNVTQVSQTINTDITVNKKVALKYKLNDYALWVDGVEVKVDTSALVPSAGTLNKLSFSSGDQITSFFYGKTKNLKVFKRALPNGELYLLTVTQYQSYQEMATALNYTS